MLKRFLFTLLASLLASYALAQDFGNATLLFKEDFGGNEVSDPVAKPEGIPQCTYEYNVDPRGRGKYALRKVSWEQPEWFYPACHTISHCLCVHSHGNLPFNAVECSTTNEQNVFGVYLDHLLVGVFSSSLSRVSSHCTWFWTKHTKIFPLPGHPEFSLIPTGSQPDSRNKTGLTMNRPFPQHCCPEVAV